MCYKTVLFAFVTMLLFANPNQTFAKNNRSAVHKEIESKYEEVYWGPEFTHEEMLKAVATEGESLEKWAEKVVKELAKAGVKIAKDVVVEAIVEGRDLPDISGDFVTIKHWHVEKIPVVRPQGLKTKIGTRDVDIPEPNTYQAYIGYRKLPKKK